MKAAALCVLRNSLHSSRSLKANSERINSRSRLGRKLNQNNSKFSIMNTKYTTIIYIFIILNTYALHNTVRAAILSLSMK